MQGWMFNSTGWLGRLVSTGLLIILVQCVFAQGDELSLQSASGNNPIEGAAVQFIRLSDRASKVHVSDKDGVVKAPFVPPYIYSVQHVSFNTAVDTVNVPGKITVFLNENNTYLEDVVITGQYEPQSAKNSVYRVTSVSKQRIEEQGAVSLQDVLSNALNIRFSRDNATGVAGISLQGIEGQNVKVLLDGVPVVGRSGVNNEVDLNQINVRDIERVEIVEGPMAVNYGSDALAGVINIITKKDSQGTFDVNVGLHEETVGDEFSLFDEGIHSPSISTGYKFHKNWYGQLSGRLNRFGGWQGENEGRSKDWYPKTQYLGDALLRYEKDEFSIYYKLSYLDELLENLGNENTPQFRDPFAIDEAYHAKRWIHQLQSDWKARKAKSHTVLSYTDYDRTSREFTKNLITEEEQNTADSNQDTTTYTSLFFRNTTTGLMSNAHVSTQLGLEGTFETAGGTTLSDGEKDLTDVAVFISAELSIGEKLKIRPGVRASYNSVFSTIPMPSINLKYEISPLTQVRLGYGRGFRAPSIRELYHEFIDANHNIIGNPDLGPERSHNFNGDISHTFADSDLQVSLGGFYNYIDDRITLFFTDVNQATTYTNLSKYKTTGGILRATFNINDFQLGGGVSYTGRYQSLNESFDVPEFVFSPEFNVNAKYTWQDLGLYFNVFYKYTGEAKRYALQSDDETGEQSTYLAETEAYQLMDLTVNKTIGNSLTVGGGIRNMLDVTSVNSTSSGGTHGGGAQAPVGYGRSFFLKMNFHLIK